ncbi:YER160C-like protein [Saccharomyces cerevisiae x Saccharomyces kudriavzevii VIN7]|uniref:YER160C-like protein n=1 Tax=Saccharomyces cerevisiae x Saccharomyces kudriavzevii (strain VIN7) TaxID=1095631 RepID=H0H0G3_SACCK|nr:YER160C-like protein [Saccharomyces cerevisiae x Saccharomyces kudriavzevii VIN7]
MPFQTLMMTESPDWVVRTVRLFLNILDPITKFMMAPPAIEESLPENQSPDSTFPKTTSDTSPEVTTVESLIADLPLPDLSREPSIKLPLSLKEPPPIHSRQTNSSLGGMDDSNVSTNTKSKKRSLEEDKTEIKVSRDTWNAKNMRSLEPPRSKKRIHLITAVKAVKSIKPIRTTLRYDEAITYDKNNVEKEKYTEAYHKEVSQLIKMNTWETDKYYGRNSIDPKNIISSMFIFNKKRDGTYKARFVARGDIQHPDTYDPGMQSNTVHHYALMTSLSDISSACLYADIKEELYIRPLPHLGMNNKLLRLKKALYGLKQSGANWYKTIKSYLIKQCGMDEVRGWSCVFKNSQVTICLFVDDMILFSKDLKANKKIIANLRRQYDTKIINLGEMTTKFNMISLA